MKKKKKSNKLSNIIFMVVCVLVGAVCGYFLASKMDEHTSWLVLGADVVALFVAAQFQTIVHETGHLLGGLKSGYGFSSFKIGSFMLVKKNNKIKIKRMKIVGMGGQCLMSPPDLVDGKISYTLYNLGGVLANVVVSILFFVFYILCRNVQFLSGFLLFVVVIGILFALMNGIPLKMGMIHNDGYNALSLGKRKEAMYALWVQLKLSEYLTQGKRLRDTPEHWLYMPDEAEKNNAMSASVGIFYANRLLDKKDFTKVVEVIDTLLNEDYAMVMLHEKLLICDKIYCNLIQNQPIVELYDKEQKQFMKQMKKFPSVLRTQYAIELCENQDNNKARKVRESFDKMATKYPYVGDIESERELMDVVERSALDKRS